MLGLLCRLWGEAPGPLHHHSHEREREGGGGGDRDGGRQRRGAPSPQAAWQAAHRGRGAALVLGSEGQGLSAEVLAACTPVAVPMAGPMESLNVAAAGAILMAALSPGAAELQATLEGLVGPQPRQAPASPPLAPQGPGAAAAGRQPRKQGRPW